MDKSVETRSAAMRVGVINTLLMLRFVPACVFACFILSIAVGGEIIPPRDRTYTLISWTRVRLAQYFYANGNQLPESLAVLRIPEKDKNTPDNMLDGWGRELGYTSVPGRGDFSDGDIVTLWSLGRDGVLGGKGEDADIVEVFWLVRQNPHGITLVVDRGEGTVGFRWTKIVLSREKVADLIQRAIEHRKHLQTKNKKDKTEELGSELEQ